MKAFDPVASLPLKGGEVSLYSAVVDTANGFAYFGTYTSPGIIVKVRLSDFTRVGAITLNTDEGYLTSAVIDTGNGFAYFGTYTYPGIVVKIRLSDFTRVGAITLDSGEDLLTSAVIDTANGFAYFGTYTSGIIVKVRLSDFTRVGAITLNTGEGYLTSAVIDATQGFAYFGGSGASPGIVVKVRLSDFTRVGSLTLDPGENSLYSAVIDTANGFAYFGTYTSPGIIVKVRLSDFTRVGAITLNTDEGYLTSAVIDTGNGFAYFGTNTIPGIVVKVRLSDFTHVAALVLNYESYLRSAVIDTANGFAYFGTGYGPGIVVKVGLIIGFTSTSVSCDTPVVVNQASTCTVTVTDTNPSPTIPSGTVTFTGGGVPNAFDTNTCTLVPGATGTASCSVHVTPTYTGPVYVVASFAGDSTHYGSANQYFTIQVNERSDTTTVNCDSPVVLDIPYPSSTCTVTVADADPAGTPITPHNDLSIVTDSSGSFGSCVLSGSGASASCTVMYTPTVVGVHRITATVRSDGYHSPSSGFFDVTVNPSTKASTVTNVSCDTPVVVNQASTCTATVTDTSSTGPTVPSGTVTFAGGGLNTYPYYGSFDSNTCTLVAGTAGTASCSVHLTLNPGIIPFDISLAATYDSDSTHNGSNSSPFSITVNGRSTATTVTCDSPVTLTIPYPASTCTVTVTDSETAGIPIVPSSYYGIIPIATDSSGSFNRGCYLSGISGDSASCTVAYTPTVIGVHRISADFGSYRVHLASSGFFDITVNPSAKAPTSTSVICDTPVVYDQVSTCTATVTDTSATSPTSPLGTVAFTGAAFDFDTCNLTSSTTGISSCSVHYTANSLTTVTVSAIYGSDSSHDGSTSIVFNLVVEGRSTTTTVICDSPLVFVIPYPTSTCTVTVTDTSTAGTPVTPYGYIYLSTNSTGTFSTGYPFYYCYYLSGTGVSASCTVTYTPTVVGGHNITALFLSYGYHIPSSSFLVISVTPSPKDYTSTTLSCDSPVVVNEVSTCTVTVTDTDTNPTSPSGTVTFPSGLFDSDTCTLVAGATGTSSCSVHYTPTSAYSSYPSATYNADPTHNGSSSPIFTIIVNGRTTTTTVTCTSPVSLPTSSVCTITVTDTSTAGTPITPSGSFGPYYNLVSDGTGTFDTYCSLTGSGTSASCTVNYSPTVVGSDKITANFRGDGSHLPSSGFFIITINPIPLHTTTTTVSCDTSVVVNQPSTCTVTVTDTTGVPTPPTGSVSFSASVVDNISFGSTTCTLTPVRFAASSCTDTLIGTRPLVITVLTSYSGDASHDVSSITSSNVYINPRTATVSVSCVPSSVSVGQASTCTATVTDASLGTPLLDDQLSGSLSVSFSSNNAGTFSSNGPTPNVCSLGGTSTTGTCSVTYTPTAYGSGTHQIAATHSGLVYAASSASSNLIVLSTLNPTTTSVSCDSPVLVLTVSTCTGTVVDTSVSGAASPSGTVTFSSNSYYPGSFDSTTCVLVAGTIGASSCSVDFTPSGASVASIFASYGADSSHDPSSSSTFDITVNGRAATLAITCDSPVALAVPPNSSSCTITVTDTDVGAPVTPSGLVYASTNSTGVLSLAYNNSQGCLLAGSGTLASCVETYTPSVVGVHEITASFGDILHTSSSGFYDITVTPNVKHSTSTTVTCDTPVVVSQASTCIATAKDTSSTGVTSPSGAVTFTFTSFGYLDSTTCVLVAGTTGTASCSVHFTPSQESVASIFASYAGDASRDPSSSTGFGITVNGRTSSTTITCDSPIALAFPPISSSCILTVTDTDIAGSPVTPSEGFVSASTNSTGVLSIGFDNAYGCILSGSGGSANCIETYTPSVVGVHRITVNFSGGTVFLSSSDFFDITVTPSALRTTTTNVTCDKPVFVNQASTCTATVTDTDASPTAPVGMVTFTLGGTSTGTLDSSCSLSGLTADSASCQATFLASTSGTADISASYSGDSTHATSSTATAFAIPANLRTTSITITSCDSPVVVNQFSTCAVTIIDTTTAGTVLTPTGSVTFHVVAPGAFLVVGTSCINISEVTTGTSTCEIGFSSAAQGIASLSATYSGDAVHSTSTTIASVSITINKRSTTTSITCLPSSIDTGSPTTCTATITDDGAGTATMPAGSVIFTTSGTGAFTGSPCTLSGSGAIATCSATYVPSGTVARTDSIDANYGGDTEHLTSSQTFGLSVTTQVQVDTTTIIVSCVPATVHNGQATTCTALVTDTSTGPTTPTGTVSFTTNSTGTFTPASTCTLTGTTGAASCSVSYTPTTIGHHFIAVAYTGDSTHSDSTGSFMVAVTSSAPSPLHSTKTVVSCSQGSVLVNTATTCTVRVVDNSKNPTVPTGTVTFTTNATGTFSPTSASCKLVAGNAPHTATCSVSYTPTVTSKQLITGSYSGDSGHAKSSGGFTVNIRSPRSGFFLLTFKTERVDDFDRDYRRD